MAYTFTRTGAQIEEIHNTVEDPKSNAQFSDDIRTIAGEYRGLWPDTGGSANKGDTYQTQVSGTPTGKYFTALQNTTVDPVGDDVNWREVVSAESLSQYTDIVYRASGGNSAVENMIAGVPVATPLGGTCKTGGSTWVKEADSGVIEDFEIQGDLYYRDIGITPSVGFDNKDLITSAALSYDVNLVRGKSFESGQITPSGRFILDGKGANLKNLSKDKPLFFDNALEVSNDTFKLTNINLDLNKANVTFGNLSGGGVWLGKGNDAASSLEWGSVIIEDVEVVNGYRAILNILSTDNVTVKRYSASDSGITGSGFFSYCGTTENCRTVNLENIVFKNSYGYGWHLYRCDRVDANNVQFLNLTKDGSAIGFTLTESKKVHIRNHVAQTDGDALEINACQDVIVENFDVNGGNRGLLVGDNGTGIDNERVTLRNGVVTGGGSFSAAINYCHKLLCEDVKFKGPISVITAQGDRASDLKFRRCEIDQNINTSLSDRRFIHESTRFLDCVYSQNENTFEMMDTGGVDLSQDEYIVIPIGPVLSKSTVFYVEVYGEFTAAGEPQMGWRRYQCVYAGVDDAGLNDILVTLEDEERGYQAARYLTLEIVGGEMRATNKGATTINGNFWLHGVRRTTVKARP